MCVHDKKKHFDLVKCILESFFFILIISCTITVASSGLNCVHGCAYMLMIICIFIHKSAHIYSMCVCSAPSAHTHTHMRCCEFSVQLHGANHTCWMKLISQATPTEKDMGCNYTLNTVIIMIFLMDDWGCFTIVSVSPQ